MKLTNLQYVFFFHKASQSKQHVVHLFMAVYVAGSGGGVSYLKATDSPLVRSKSCGVKPVGQTVKVRLGVFIKWSWKQGSDVKAVNQTKLFCKQ